MKRLLFLMILALVAMLFSLFSCSEKQDEETPATPVTDDYSELFIQTREDTELSFFSFFGREGFDSYILSFPNAWIEKKWGEEFTSDRKGFFEKMDVAIAGLAQSRTEDYGETFEVAYSNILDEKIEGEDFEALKKVLEDYGVDTSGVTEAVRAHYSVAYFSDAEKTSMLSESKLVLTLFYIKGDGWYVSPDNYIPVEF